MRTWILPADEPDAREIFCDTDAQRLYVRGALHESGVSGYIANLVANEERDGFGVWPVVDKATREVVGACGFSRVRDLDGEIEVEWVVKPGARGKGIALEAARAAIAYAFDRLQLDRICALVDAENAPSIAIANRLGMRFDRIVRAYRRDLMRYRIERPASA